MFACKNPRRRYYFLKSSYIGRTIFSMSSQSHVPLGCTVYPLSFINNSNTTRSRLKTGYIEIARLESSADAVRSAIVSPAVATTTEVHCQRPPAGAQWLHYAQCLSSSNYHPSRILYSQSFIHRAMISRNLTTRLSLFLLGCWFV